MVTLPALIIIKAISVKWDVVPMAPALHSALPTTVRLAYEIIVFLMKHSNQQKSSPETHLSHCSVSGYLVT